MRRENKEIVHLERPNLTGKTILTRYKEQEQINGHPMTWQETQDFLTLEDAQMMLWHGPDLPKTAVQECAEFCCYLAEHYSEDRDYMPNIIHNAPSLFIIATGLQAISSGN